MDKEEKNSQAYLDVLDLESPSIPDDKDYMDSYRFWRGIARWPEDSKPYHLD